MLVLNNPMAQPKQYALEEKVILVDTDDKSIGSMEKMQAHRQGALHRAFSVFIFNNQGQLLLQQRALDKYHSGGVWTNTCCSHPKIGESTLDAAHRRLSEEMGLVCNVSYMFNFTYYAILDRDLIEHELDHVFFGISDDLPVPEPTEVAAFKYMGMNELEDELNSDPAAYSAWLKICFNTVMENYRLFFKK